MLSRRIISRLFCSSVFHSVCANTPPPWFYREYHSSNGKYNFHKTCPTKILKGTNKFFISVT